MSCLQANGAQALLYGQSLLSDRLVTDIAAGPGCTAYATTRASREGHFALRYLDGSGASLVRSDARQAALSPDGRRLAVTLLDQHERFQLAILPATGKANERLVTRGQGHVAHPVWSPDGSRIAFLSQSVRDGIHYDVRTGNTHLFMTDLHGGLLQLTSGGGLSLVRPLWTERGIYVVASTKQRHSRLLRVTPSARR